MPLEHSPEFAGHSRLTSQFPWVVYHRFDVPQGPNCHQFFANIPGGGISSHLIIIQPNMWELQIGGLRDICSAGALSPATAT